MIVVDTSALVAILWSEPEANEFGRAIQASGARLISAPTRLEAYVVCLRRQGELNAIAMERLIAGLDLVTVPFDELQFSVAREAYRAFRGRPAKLNLGDCFSYALAKSRGLPLLFKGGDFPATDVEALI